MEADSVPKKKATVRELKQKDSEKEKAKEREKEKFIWRQVLANPHSAKGQSWPHLPSTPEGLNLCNELISLLSPIGEQRSAESGSSNSKSKKRKRKEAASSSSVSTKKQKVATEPVVSGSGADVPMEVDATGGSQDAVVVRSYTLRSDKVVEYRPRQNLFNASKTASGQEDANGKMEQGVEMLEEVKGEAAVNDELLQFVTIGINDVTKQLERMIHSRRAVEVGASDDVPVAQVKETEKTNPSEDALASVFLSNLQPAIPPPISLQAAPPELVSKRIQLAQLSKPMGSEIRIKRDTIALDLDLPSFRYLAKPNSEQDVGNQPSSYALFQDMPSLPPIPSLPDFHTQPHPPILNGKPHPSKNSALVTDSVLKELYRPMVESIYREERERKINLKKRGAKMRRVKREVERMEMLVAAGRFVSSKQKMQKKERGMKGSRKKKEKKEQVDRGDARIVLSLTDHLLQMVGSWNALCEEETKADEGDEQAERKSSESKPDKKEEKVFLVALPQGSEVSLAKALGVRRAAAISLSSTFPSLEHIVSLLSTNGISPISLPNLNRPRSYEQTHIKHLKTSVPTDLKERKEVKAEKKKKRKEEIRAKERKRKDALKFEKKLKQKEQKKNKTQMMNRAQSQ
ncbi:hypothetical protein BT69DRAFT_1290680 [Atractiella rhizophila]|nr:hypothetical protein BT69DRAFT_1290680 [Atractiella rhizophila]